MFFFYFHFIIIFELMTRSMSFRKTNMFYVTNY